MLLLPPDVLLPLLQACYATDIEKIGYQLTRSFSGLFGHWNIAIRLLYVKSWNDSVSERNMTAGLTRSIVKSGRETEA